MPAGRWRRTTTPRGGHGFGMNKLGLPADRWIEQFHEWMATEGFIG